MNNKYSINGDITTIYLEKRDGSLYETLIDTEDLQKIIAFNKTWHVGLNNGNNKYYVHSTLHLGVFNNKSKSKTIYLHRFILNAENGTKIDHINHNPLDNRKSNLRFISQANNLKNRSEKNSNNKSGYRNVCYNKLFNNTPWQVQLQIDGKNTVLRRFNDVHEAGKFAEEMRNRYYGKFAGKS